MKKNYVLDTNVLLHDPRAVLKFEDNNVIIPIYVLEEVDNFKRDTTELGRNARAVARLLDEARGRGSLADAVPIAEGGTLRVHVPDRRQVVGTALNSSSPDHAILQSALDVQAQSPNMRTVFVTMDVNLRIRADVLGLPCEPYENQAVRPEKLSTGMVELEVTVEQLDAFISNGTHQPDDRSVLHANACVILKAQAPERERTALGRFHLESGFVRALRVPREGVLGIRPRNAEQSFALDLLLDESVRLVTLVGMAGTGKTLLAVAAGLSKTVESGNYTRLLVSRPIIPMGRDLGFLPGSVSEKMNPWMQPIYDNLDFLLVAAGKKRGLGTMSDLMKSGQVQVEPLTYIRGRSLPQQYVIVDEAQNLTPHEVKTIITRCGEGSKIILTGDPGQIDNPYVDSSSNGLTVAADRMRGEAIVGHVVLSRGERSELSNIAANRL